MAKFLFEANYNTAGTRGLVSEGGSSRREQVEKMLGGLGGELESMYFSVGDTDVYGIVDLPDNVSGAAARLAINSSGAVTIKVTPLLTPEEMDEAAAKSVDYRPPGN